MPRSIKEWVGRTDDSMPPRSVFDRIWERQDGKDAITGVAFQSGDKIVRDHIVPLADGGENRESNLQLILLETHKPKTAAEATERARTRRIHEKHRGYVRKHSSFQSQGFPKREPQRTASRPIRHWMDETDGVSNG